MSQESVEGTYQAHEASTARSPADLRVELQEVRGFGERVFVHGHLRGHGAGSSASFERELWGVLEWRNGKQFRYTAFGSKAEALGAVGLSGVGTQEPTRLKSKPTSRIAVAWWLGHRIAP